LYKQIKKLNLKKDVHDFLSLLPKVKRSHSFPHFPNDKKMLVISSGSNPAELINPCLNLAARDSWLTEFPAIKWEIFSSPCSEYSSGMNKPQETVGSQNFPPLNGKYSTVPARNTVQVWNQELATRDSWITGFSAIKCEIFSNPCSVHSLVKES
jgi:hypothetical protein